MSKQIILDAVHERFNAQPAHSRRVDLHPGQKVPPGIRGMGDAKSFWLDTATLVGIVIVGGWLLKKFGK